MNIPHPLLNELAKNPQDKIVIINEAGKPLYVIISYAGYKNTIERTNEKQEPNQTSNVKAGLTSEQLLDKINQEIAQWYESTKTDEYHQSEEERCAEKDTTLYLETIDE